MNVGTDGSRPVIACDFSGAADTPAQRRAEYERLFTGFLTGRERAEAGISFWFRAAPGLADWVRDLARREQQCCPFFAFAVTDCGETVRWEASVTDDPLARQVLAEFYRLPETLAAGEAGLPSLPRAAG